MGADETYRSPGPKRRIDGVWMPKERYEELLASEGRASALEGELEGARERARRLGRASADLLDSLHAYYFYDDDRELHAINALRRLLGLREQMPKCCEAEAEADIAEGKAVPDHETYHRKLHGLDAASEAREGE